MEKFNLFLSTGEPLYKDIVKYSRREDLNLEAFYIRRYITEAEDQAQIEYHTISNLNKTSEDDSGIVIEGPSYKFTVIKTDKEDQPYITTECRAIKVLGNDLCQLPTDKELFPGQYSITFITKNELESDVLNLFKSIIY